MKMSSSKVRSLVASCILGDARLGAKPGRIGDRRAGGSDAERGNVDRADRFHIRREDAKRETARWRVTRASVFASALSPEWRAPVSDDVPSTTASRSFARLGARRREGRWRGIMRRSLSAVARRLRGASDASRSPTRVAALADASSAVAILNRGAPLARASSPPRPPHAPPSPRSPSRTPFPTSTPPSVASFTPTAPATSPRRPSASSASTSSVAPSVARAPRRIPPRSRRSPPRTTTSASSSTSTPRDSSAPDGTRRHPREDGNPRATPQRPLRRLRRRRRRDDVAAVLADTRLCAATSPRRRVENHRDALVGNQLPTPISIRVTSSTLGWCTSFTTPRRIPNRHPRRLAASFGFAVEKDPADAAQRLERAPAPSAPGRVRRGRRRRVALDREETTRAGRSG